MPDTMSQALLGLTLLLSGATLFLSLRLRSYCQQLAQSHNSEAELKTHKLSLEARLAEQARKLQELKDREQELLAEHKAELQALRHQQFTAAAQSNEAASEQAVLDLLRQLQERGRFLDFATAELHRLADAEVGAAARVVQQGVKAVLQDYFELLPVRSEAEGSTVAIPEDGEARRDVRVLQDVELASPASTGRLVHRGWKVHAIRLPQSLGQADEGRSILAPAEIQIH